MKTSRHVRDIATWFARGLAAVVLVALALAAPARAADSSDDDSLLPLDKYTSDKGRALATRYAAGLHALSDKVYHCMPWVEVKKYGIGFYKPKHLEGDARYYSINFYIDQTPSPEFSAFTVEERASRMFSRYVPPMLRRMATPPGLLADPALDGFTVILAWLKQTTPKPVTETIGSFLDRAAVVDFLGGKLPTRELAGRARVLGWDGDKALGPLKVASWDDDFVMTYKVANYEVAPGVTCP
jgi:hypothetical protein